MEQLGIDISLLIAQIVNFGIILFLLKKFAYAPVLAMIDKRKKQIEEGLALKDSMEKRIEEMQTEKNKMLDQARKEGQHMIKEAIVEAKKRAQELANEEKKKLAEDRKRMLEEIEQERTKIVSHAKKQALQYAVLISEKILDKKIDAKEHQRLLEQTVAHLSRS